jgi:Raf kinase inhibitor-like YbhB/YbcL family protein
MAKLAVGATAFLGLSSSSFEAGGPIPKAYSCAGADVSPELHWEAPPAGTTAFALIAEDPDAPGGTFVHWLVFDLPASLRRLPQGGPISAKQGRNDFGRDGYGGPCPPPGRPHHYHFILYALDQALGLRAGASAGDLRAAMQGHVLAQSELVGTFGR